MKLRPFLTLAIFAVALPALAQPNCGPFYPAVGTNCSSATNMGWAIAGLGTDSIVTYYVPPFARGPVTFQITALNSNLGNAYAGFFGIMVGVPGQVGTMLVTLSNAKPTVLNPGQAKQFLITQVCFDPTCTAPAPADAVANMFSMQLLILSPNIADLQEVGCELTVQFLNGSQVTFEETETATPSGPNTSLIPGINLGATPAGRYVFSGAAVNLPFDAFSVMNPSASSTIAGNVALQDIGGIDIAMAPIPAIPPGGAAGYLLIGRTPGDSLGLFPSSTTLPAGSDGIFHGILLISMNGPNVVLAQEYNGNAMLNLLVLH